MTVDQARRLGARLEPEDQTGATRARDRRRAKRAGDRVDAGDELAGQLQFVGLEAPQREYRFHPSRRWRFDLAWPKRRIAVEIEGAGIAFHAGEAGAALTGRHVTPAGFREDCVKYGEAFAMGWSILRVLPDQVRSGDALRWLEARLRA